MWSSVAMPSSATWPCAALSRADLAPRTTVRVGGRAEWLLEPATPAELEAAWCEARGSQDSPRIECEFLDKDGELGGLLILIPDVVDGR